jgi:4,5-DOPA dioxygenase extradiol
MDPKNNALASEMGIGSPGHKFLLGLDKQFSIKENVRAILVISAHWEERGDVKVLYHEGPTPKPLLYDYYGFPDETYAPHLLYPAKTDLAVADRVIELLNAANIPCGKERTRGFDHGVFIPLKVAIEDASIPIVQLSLKGNLDEATHVRMGEALRALRDEQVLIIGSGQTTHNLGEIRGAAFGNGSGSKKIPAEAWATEFTEWLRHTLVDIGGQSYTQAKTKLINMMREAPHAARAHPRTEHLVPLHVAFGAAGGADSCAAGGGSAEGIRVERIYNEMVFGSMSLDSYAFF